LATRAASKFGTPLYLSRWRPVLDKVADVERRLASTPVRSWLSFKTHPVLPLAAAWSRTGRGIEVTSEYEMAAVASAGCRAEQLLVNGVAKHSWMRALPHEGLRVHFDSVREADVLLETAARQRWRIGLRCHVPAERDRTEPEFGGQFGLSWDEVACVARQCASAGVDVEGLHFHLGQGHRRPDDYGRSVDYLVQVARAAGITPRYVDCGGGLDDDADVASTLANLEAAVGRAREALPTLNEVWLENGRYLTRASAALVVRVLDVKIRRECRYVICDGGRTNHALAADHGAHKTVVVPDHRGAKVLTTVAGPTCMTDDRLGRFMLPEGIGPGDLIVWLEAGAYHLPWETRFSQGLCAVVWADETDALSLARARETPAAWSRSWQT
jgi:diaminopimelate decarboxylase